MNEFFATFEMTNRMQMILGALVMLELILKGIALWRSARRNQSAWFVFLFIISSAGILPIIYLLINRKKKDCCTN